MTSLGKMPPFRALPYTFSWTGRTTKIIPVSYGFNGWLYSERGVDKASSYWRTCNVKGVANIPVLGDGGPCVVWPYHTDVPPGSDEAATNPQMYQCINRHNGGINMLFMDGSVRKVGLKELWTLKWSRDFDTAGPWTKTGGVKPEAWPAWMQRFKDY
jgi:prepilin-type processing-associated H-X9-DG protein